MEKLTLSNIKNLRKDKEAEELARAVAVCVAKEKAISEIVDSYRKPLLEKLQMKAKDTGEIIKDQKHTYLAQDEDFEIYINEMSLLHKKNGFELERGYCPQLIAEHETIKAKRDLIDRCAKFTGLFHSHLMLDFKSYKKAVRLNMGLFGYNIA